MTQFPQALVTQLQQPQPTTVEEAVYFLDQTQVALGGYTNARPLAAFNFLYHRITSEILKRLGPSVPTPGDPSWKRRGEHPLNNHFDRSLDRLSDEPLVPLPPEAAEFLEGKLAEVPPEYRPLLLATIEEVRRQQSSPDPYFQTLRSRWTQRGFEDPAFMEKLDVQFVLLYLNALKGWSDNKVVPTCWARLFEKWDDAADEGPVTGALLGINAHIMHDLALAVLSSHEEAGDPVGGPVPAPRYNDYLDINDIFRIQIPILFEELKKLLPGWKRWIYELAGLGDVLDDATLWIITEAREQAWEHAVDINQGTVLPPAGDPPVDGSTNAFVGGLADGILALKL